MANNTTVDEEAKVRNKRKRVIVFTFIAVILVCAIAAPIIISQSKPQYQYKHTGLPQQQLTSQNDVMVDCSGRKGTESECKQNGCIWQRTKNPRAPRCIYPKTMGYQIEGQVRSTDQSHQFSIRQKLNKTIFDTDIHRLVDVRVDMYSPKSLRIKFMPNGTAKPFEIPEEAIPVNDENQAGERLYNVTIQRGPVFGIIVTRRSTGTVVFNSSVPGLMLSEQFLQITNRLPSGNLYGFGEHNHQRFKHDLNWKTWPMFTRDTTPTDDWNLYGSHPVYMNVERDGNANMVFLRNSNGMDIQVQPEPFPAVTYRVIGGVLDFFIFLGPTPGEAVQQYVKTVGMPVMPPYWSLGFHLCRYGYKNLAEMKSVRQRNIAAGIPFDTQWADIDYMYKKFDFTYDKVKFSQFPDFTNELHNSGQKLVVIVDPGVGANQNIYKEAQKNSPGYDMYNDGHMRDIFIRMDGSELQGKVWPGLTVFPDFTNLKNTTEFWKYWIQYFMQNETIHADGLWIDMNEPSNFVAGSTRGCQRNRWNNPPYVMPILEGEKDNGSLYYQTICMDAEQHWGKHYDVHNLYGHSESMVTNRALRELFPGKRPFILTRSTFSGTSAYAAKWLGDNRSQWSDMHWSIVGLLEFSIFGFPMIGADICGFNGNATYEMCLRWHQLGAFYPFSRNHNGIYQTPQDPGAWNQTFTSNVRRHLRLRYKLLPYTYTLFKEAHVLGTTVVRPLMFEFPTDSHTWDIDSQFLLGSSLLISPVLQENVRRIQAYFPKGRWYDYYKGDEIPGPESGRNVTLDAPLSNLNLHLRGGNIIPVQEPDNTTKTSRLNPMGLLVALNENLEAFGTLFLDDGESDYSFQNGTYLELQFHFYGGERLDINVVHNKFTPAGNLTFNTIDIYGSHRHPSDVIVDGRHIKSASQISNIIRLSGFQLDVTNNHTITLEMDKR